MFTGSVHSAMAVAGLALLLFLTASSLHAFSSRVSGCQLLRDQAAVICTAKVSCRSSAAAVDAIRPLFARCAAGEALPHRAAEAALGAFKSPRYFRCCIGNDLMPMLSSLPLDE